MVAALAFARHGGNFLSLQIKSWHLLAPTRRSWPFFRDLYRHFEGRTLSWNPVVSRGFRRYPLYRKEGSGG